MTKRTKFNLQCAVAMLLWAALWVFLAHTFKEYILMDSPEPDFHPYELDLQAEERALAIKLTNRREQ